MKKRIAAAATAVVVLAGAAAASVPIVEHRAAERIKTEIERDGVTKVESVEVGLFDRRVTFANLQTSQVGKVSVQRWSLAGLSWPLSDMLEGRTPLTGWHLGDPIQARHVVVTDLHVDDTRGQSWRVGTLVLEGLDLARYDGDVDPGPYSFAILSARILQALSVQRVQESDISVSSSVGAEHVSVADVTLEKVANGKFGGFALSDLQVAGSKPGDPLFRLDRLKASGIDLDRVLASLSAPGWRLGMPTGRITVDSASATGFGGQLLARYGISLGSVTTDTTRQEAGVTRVRTRVDGFVLAPPLRSLEGLQVRMALTAMGLKELRLGFDCAGLEDRNKGELTIGHCALAGPDLGEVDFAAEIQGADAPFWQAIDDGNLALLGRSKVALASAKLVLADRSLLERWLKAVATASGQTPAVARSMLAQQVRQFQPPGVLITEDMTKLLDTAARFVEQGGTLTVECKPDPPLGIRQLGALATPGPDLINLLGMTATLAAPK